MTFGLILSKDVDKPLKQDGYCLTVLKCHHTVLLKFGLISITRST